MKTATIVTVLAILSLLLVPRFLSDLLHHVPDSSKEPVTLFFIGDIMLARDVENYLEKEGAAYPFRKLGALLSTPDITIGNFEGVVSEPHVKAGPFTFQFSVRPEYLIGLKDAGFDLLSLANNHSSDYGDEAVLLTKTLCIQNALRCAGEASVAEAFVHEIHGMHIGFLFANTTWGTENVESLTEDMGALRNESDIQIAYMHWGTEYELVHNDEQERLAHALIDAGADVVIGHHPHVVQDVAFYKEKPIFYSLGNFIFDQYWNTDVQTGLGVRMHINEDTVAYEAIPFTTRNSRVQPMIMDENGAEALFKRILGNAEGNSFSLSR